MKFIRILPHNIALVLGKYIGKLLRLVLWKKVDTCETRCVLSLGVGVTIARDIVRKSFENLGMSAVEFIRLPKIKHDIRKFVSFSDKSKDILVNALSRGKGAILISGHMANWELAAARIIHEGFDLHAVYTPQRDNTANSIIDDIRQNTSGMHMIESEGRALREIFRVLKSGGIIVIMQDLDARHDGVITNFLGMPASTHEGVVKLYRKFRAPVIPVRCLRDSNNPAHHEAVISEILSDKADKDGKPFGEDIMNSLNMCNEILESWIRQRPDLWFWILDKWEYTTKNF